MSRYRHWKNHAQGGETTFVTSTALDFAHVFREDHHKDLMAASMIEDCRRTGTYLHAFVVMVHHIHLLATMPQNLSVSALMKRIKLNSSRRISPLLSTATRHELSEQLGLNGSAFWKRSFRSVVVESPAFLYQKGIYIHQNPVRAAICEEAENYRWSSAWAYRDGLVDADRCLDLDTLIKFYAPHGLPPVRSSRSA